MKPTSSPATLNDKAYRLFAYLRELTALNLSKVLDLDAYDRVVWFSEIPETEGCFTVVRTPVGERAGVPWIELRRRVEPQAPIPPKSCEGWYSKDQIRKSSLVPELYTRIIAKPYDLKTGDPAVYAELVNFPDVSVTWSRYIKLQWEPWAIEHKLWQRHQDFYTSLFTIEQQAKRLGEAYELLLGLGLLVWKPSDGPQVRRHLVVARAHLRFEAESGMIVLDAASDGAKPSMEYEMIDPASRPTADTIKSCEAIVEACGDEVFSSSMEGALHSWVNAMDAEGSYRNSLPPTLVGGSKPEVAFAPALILRRRNRKSIVSLLEGIANRLKKMEPASIPFGIQRLCQVVEESPALDEGDRYPNAGTGNGSNPDEEVYFPLLSNDEQRAIVKRLRNGRGVLVQGPPGTGKSQTIANLICHLLADGKRVLITSQTERALKVLHGKLPREIQPLCVTVLGSGETELKNMENSVMGISNCRSGWNPDAADQDIYGLEHELSATRQVKAEIEARLREARGRETNTHNIVKGVYSGTAPAIARRLEVERDKFGWFPDSISENLQLPFTANDVRSLAQALRDLPADRRREINETVCVPKAIPTTERMSELLRIEEHAKQRATQHGALLGTTNCVKFMSWPEKERLSLLQSLESLRAERVAVEQNAQSWLQKALADCLGGRPLHWMQLLDTLEASLYSVRDKIDRAAVREVTYPTGKTRANIRGDAQSILEHMRAGGGLGFWFFRPSIVFKAEYIINECRVDGRRCDSLTTIEELFEHLLVERHLEVIWEECAPYFTKIDGSLRRQIAEITQQVGLLRQLKGLIDRIEDIRIALRSRDNGFIEPLWSDPRAVGQFISELDAADAALALRAIQECFYSATSELDNISAHPFAHKSIGEMLDALKNRDKEAFSSALLAAEALIRDRAQWSVALVIRERMIKYAPKYALAIEQDPASPELLSQLNVLEEAWNYSRAAAWLHKYSSDSGVGDGEHDIKRTEAKIAHLIERLTSKLAWRHCMNRLTASQREHMVAWTQAIRRIGRGTGVRAVIHRSNARAHMEEARAAIPAWIMPFYRVAETGSDHPEPYDVVIVDEASQSGPEACALMYMGKKIVVVGDDKQISPEAVGVERNQVDQLQQLYLYDFEHADALGVEESLFSQAQIRFGGRIRLKEHFRCMPEIIGFSNQLCYRDEPLLPLRQYPPNRLQPIVTCFVENGQREGSGAYTRNMAEAQSVADAVIRCIQDPAYEGKSIGVISLLGEGQAETIRQLVIKQIDSREIESRELTFGDAYSFQGDERDIIFLSMVAAPNVNNAALTGTKAVQRFNVAASRARDQVWLFHSMHPEDFNTEDVRYKILMHYLNPLAAMAGEPDWELCESGFETEVGRMIYARGYTLRLQFEPFGPGGKRIDMVIEGLESRLAVECDGDAFHTSPEDIHNDLVRQRQLERCGFTFWRIGETEFRIDREKALASLWRKLEAMGIKPAAEYHLNAVTPPPSQVRILVSPPPADIIEPPGRASVQAFPLRSVQTALPVDIPGELFTQIESKISPQPPAKPQSKADRIEETLLGILQRKERKQMDTMALILETTRQLGASVKKADIAEALNRMRDSGRVKEGANYIRINQG